jgi:hypothetical protein
MASTSFFSYAHLDDANARGALTQLATQLSQELSILSGEERQIWHDRVSLRWGDDWRNEIDFGLRNSTFFIAVLTPTYFRRTECREELLAFASTAQGLGVTELILPVLYVSVPELEASDVAGVDVPDDQAAFRLVRRFQWIDWTQLRLLDSESSEVRGAIFRMAQRILDVERDLESRVLTSASDQELSSNQSPADDDEPPGFLDIVAQGEESMNKLGEHITEVVEVMSAVSRNTDAATEQIERSDSIGKGSAGRLVAARTLATNLTPEAGRFETLATSILEDVVQIDPAINALIEAVKEKGDTLEPDEEVAVATFVIGIQELARSTHDAMESATAFALSLEQNMNWSRDLRKPLRRIHAAVLQIADVDSFASEWSKRAAELA